MRSFNEEDSGIELRDSSLRVGMTIALLYRVGLGAAQNIVYTITHSGFQVAEGVVNVVNQDVTVNLVLLHVGTPVNQNETVRVYPNPFSLQLMLEGLAQVRQVEVISLIGQCMLLMENKGNKILSLPTENLQPGLYFIPLTGKDGMRSPIKVVKQ